MLQLEARQTPSIALPAVQQLPIIAHVATRCLLGQSVNHVKKQLTLTWYVLLSEGGFPFSNIYCHYLFTVFLFNEVQNSEYVLFIPC